MLDNTDVILKRLDEIDAKIEEMVELKLRDQCPVVYDVFYQLEKHIKDCDKFHGVHVEKKDHCTYVKCCDMSNCWVLTDDSVTYDYHIEKEVKRLNDLYGKKEWDDKGEQIGEF